MRLAHFLFKPSLRLQRELTDVPDGELVIELALEGEEKKWLHYTDCSKHELFKTIIISDWSLSLYESFREESTSHQTATQHLCESLHREGFTVYFLQGTEFLRYAEGMHPLDFIFDDIEPHPEALIKRRAFECLGLAACDVAILNYTSLRQLLKLNELTHPDELVYVNLEHLKKSKYPFTEIMDSFGPKDTFLLDIEISDAAPVRQLALDNAFEREVQTAAQERSLSILYHFVADDLADFINAELLASIKNFKIHTCIFKTFQEDIDADDDALTYNPLMDLDPVFEVIQGLEQLQLQHMMLKVEGPTPQGFRGIRHLSLRYCIGSEGEKLHGEDLTQFLYRTPKLTSLEIISCNIQTFVQWPLSLRHLELDVVSVDMKSLLNTLETLPNLNTLILNGFEIINEGPWEVDIVLPIKHLELSNAGSGRIGLLAYFLNAAQHLESLTLRDWRSEKDDLAPIHAGALQQLKTLRLMNIQGTKKLLRQLAPIINQLPSLETLELVQCDGWELIQLNPKCLLKSLTVNLQKASKNDRDLSWIHALPHLETLSLTTVSFKTYPQTTPPAHLSTLRSLSLRDALDVDTNTLYLFLQNLTQLQDLQLEQLNLEHGEPCPKFNPPLQSLRKIHFDSASSKDISLFQNVVDSSPNVRQVEIYHGTVVSNIPLPFLQELSIHEKDLAALKSWVNHAKDLHLFQSYANFNEASKLVPARSRLTIFLNVDFLEKQTRVPQPPLFNPERALFAELPRDFDPDASTQKGYHQGYLLQQFCTYLMWTTPEALHDTLKEELKNHLKGLCDRFTCMYLLGMEGGPLEGGLVDYIQQVQKYTWSDAQKASILADPAIHFFFNTLRNWSRPTISPPLYVGLFELSELHELLNVSCADIDEPHRIYLTNLNHACGLLITGFKMYFYDPNHPDFCYQERKSGFDKTSFAERKQLLSCIHQSLGQALSIRWLGDDAPMPLSTKAPTPENTLLFAKHGGLTLSISVNQLHWHERFSKLTLGVEDKKQLLKALFLRDAQETSLLIQACMDDEERSAMLHDVGHWLSDLGHQETFGFKRQVKDHVASLQKEVFDAWIQTLKSALPHLTEKAYLLCQSFIDLATTTEEIIRPKTPVMRAISPQLLAALETPHVSSEDTLLTLLRTSFGKNRLLKCQSIEHIQSMMIVCQKLAMSHGIPFFVIRSLEDLQCSKDHLSSDDSLKLSKVPGPSGLLYNFLMKHKTTPSLLFIDWSSFKPNQLIQSNALLDEERLADGVPLPLNMALISLHDVGNPDVYLGADFLDRHHRPHFNLTLPALKPNYPSESPTPEGQSLWFNLYESPQWKKILLGKTTFNDKGLCFEPSPFLSACLQNKAFTLTLKNAPWGCPDFQAFWDDLQTTRQFTLHDKRIEIPESTRFVYEMGYGLEDEPLFIKEFTEGTFILPLNPSTLASFHESLTIQADGCIQKGPGWLEAHHGETIHCILTRALESSEMRLLLAAARTHGITLKFIDKCSHEPLRLSLEETNACLAREDILTLCADERSFHELFYTIKTHKTRFELIEKGLLRALKLGQTVLLKGALNPQILDHMPMLHERKILINGHFQPFSGTLLIANHCNQTPSFIKDVPMHGDIDFEENLCNALISAAQSRPVIQVCGPTGGGKSTFFQKSKMLRARAAVHMGEEAIEAWIADKTPGPNILVIDEANLQKHKHSHFEDLYNPNPSIFHGDKVHRLSPEHVVVLLTNPMSYGGEREILPILQRHPALLNFPPFTQAYLQNTILEPLLGPADPIIPMLLKMYADVLSYKSEANPVPVTPRELQTMALTYLAHGRSMEAIYPILHTLLPKSAHRHFKVPLHLEKELLHMFMRIHMQSRLGGVLISGEPGAGKSYFLRKTLSDLGVKFEVIPPMQLLQKKTDRLTQCFHEGRKVILEEFNSDSSMEALLNALLMGHDLQGRPANTPGFAIFITQNPPDYAGRRTLSLALQRRLLHINFPLPTHQHLQDMLLARGNGRLSRLEVQHLAEDFMWLRDEKKPISLRILMQVVDALVAKKAPRTLFFTPPKRPHADTVSESTDLGLLAKCCRSNV